MPEENRVGTWLEKSQHEMRLFWTVRRGKDDTVLDLRKLVW